MELIRKYFLKKSLVRGDIKNPHMKTLGLNAGQEIMRLPFFSLTVKELSRNFPFLNVFS